MKFAVIGAAVLALTGAGGIGYTVAGQADQPEPEQSAQLPASPTYEPLNIPTPHTAGTGPSSSHTTTDNSVSIDLSSTSVVFNTELELDMSEDDVLVLLGNPEWEEVQSTDFGDDVIWWYGDWGVYFSDGYVNDWDYYG
jgi:hypothetical protein